MPDHRLALTVVSAYPPSRGPLNEYGHHLVRHLAGKPEVATVTVLADRLAEGTDEPSTSLPITVRRTWRFDSVATPIRVARAVLRDRPDAVVFNQHFASYGASKVAAALGLMTPLLVRLLGVRTLVLQHNIVETVDLDSAGFGGHALVAKAYRLIGAVLTWLVLRAHVVAVTVPAYVDILRDRYGASNVVLIPHGTFEEPAAGADTAVPPGPARILTFGKFGTYKKVEPLVAAVRELSRHHDVELVVAGTDSPNAPGYLAEVERAAAGLPVTFTGYVEEEDVAGLFESATVVVFPYESTTGSSGVLHQAGEHGRAVVLPDIGDFTAVIEAEGFVGEYFEPGDAASLTVAIDRLLSDPERREIQARRNLAASRAMPLADLADWYLMHLG